MEVWNGIWKKILVWNGIWNGRFLVWNGNGMEENCQYGIWKNRLPFHTMPSLWDIVLRISEDLISVCRAVNPRLPLISDKAIQRKVEDLLDLVKDINRKHAKVRAKSNLDDKLDKLFDISACTCLLEMVPCNDVRVKCTASNCIQDHFLCICATKGAFRLNAKQRKAKVGDLRNLREWSITSLAKVANLRKWLLIFATGRFIG